MENKKDKEDEERIEVENKAHDNPSAKVCDLEEHLSCELVKDISEQLVTAHVDTDDTVNAKVAAVQESLDDTEPFLDEVTDTTAENSEAEITDQLIENIENPNEITFGDVHMNSILGVNDKLTDQSVPPSQNTNSIPKGRDVG